jgi:hypothetical protein
MQQLNAGATQNALAKYQLSSAQRADTLNEGMLNYMRSPEYKPEGLTQFGTPGVAALKAINEAQNAGLTGKKLQGEIEAQPAALAKVKGEVQAQQMKALGSGLITALKDPSDTGLNTAFSMLDAQGIDTKALRTQFSQVIDPKQRIDLIQSYVSSHPEGIAAMKLVAPDPIEVKLGDGSIKFIDKNPNSPTFKQEVMPSQAAGMTPYQVEQNKISQGQLKVSQGNLNVAQTGQQQALELANRPVFDPISGGFISRPTAATPTGKFTPLPEIQTQKDQQATVKALKSAGYDPVTGKDDISTLIEKSTSGGLQAGTTGLLGFIGYTTPGKAAIAALEGTANQIATDLAGGKLGAGISNTDREFIVSALGDVANPRRTAAERLAGWTAAKDRMVRVGLVPPPASAAPAAGGVMPSLDAIAAEMKKRGL